MWYCLVFFWGSVYSFGNHNSAKSEKAIKPEAHSGISINSWSNILRPTKLNIIRLNSKY
jgi:hypothetical protein